MNVLYFDPLIRQYQLIKRQLPEFHSQLLDTIKPTTLLAAARKLGLAKRNTLYLPNETRECLLYDFVLYAWTDKSNCPVFTTPLTGFEDMQPSLPLNTLSVFEVRGMGNGRMSCQDIFTEDEPFEAVDLTLSKETGVRLLIMRTVEFPDFISFTGVGLPIHAESLYKAVLRGAERLFVKFNADTLYDLDEVQTMEFEAMLITTGLRHKADELFHVEEV